jgi:hypothetical protein
MVALGTEIAGIFSPSDTMAQQMAQASKAAGEKVWRMPMEDNYWWEGRRVERGGGGERGVCWGEVWRMPMEDNYWWEGGSVEIGGERDAVRGMCVEARCGACPWRTITGERDNCRGEELGRGWPRWWW